MTETHRVYQSIISEAVSEFVPKPEAVFGDPIPTLEDLAERSACELFLMDATLATSANHGYDSEL
jgi:hypothetical protein